MSLSKKTAGITRRSFLKTAAASVLAPAIVPSATLGRQTPSNKILMGCIGVGRQGQGDMKELIYRGLDLGVRVVAVCDVDAQRMRDSKNIVETIYKEELGIDSYKGCSQYSDFRELLARKDIDGVTIATPDFWHAPIAIAAANAGKDMYLEKPLTYSIIEGQKLVKAVRKNKRILQVGSQQRSSVHFRMACEIARNQRIGKLHTIRVWLPQDQGTGDATPMTIPDNLNYSFWLGPTPEAPYTEHRVHPQADLSRPGWLQIERYCLGMITGWGSHMNDTAQWGNGTDHSGPIEIEAKGEFPARGLFDVHQAFSAKALYANGVKLIMETGNPAGVRFEGDKGWVFVKRYELQASDPKILHQNIGEDKINLYKSSNHMRNFLESMRSRKDPITPVEVGHRSNSICVLTHIAMKLKRKLHWDPQAEHFVNDEEANKWLDYPHRKPWQV